MAPASLTVRGLGTQIEGAIESDMNTPKTTPAAKLAPASSSSAHLDTVLDTVRTVQRVVPQVAAWVWPRRHLIWSHIVAAGAPTQPPAAPPAPEKLRWAIPVPPVAPNAAGQRASR